MAKKKVATKQVDPGNYSDCLECVDCLGVTYYNRIDCKSAIIPVENCKDRKIACVRFVQK